MDFVVRQLSLSTSLEPIPHLIPPGSETIHSSAAVERGHGGSSVRIAFTILCTSTIPLIFRSSPFYLVLLWLLLCLFTNPVNATGPGPPASFGTIAINANGLGDVMKTHTLGQILSANSPHAWVLTETKSGSCSAHRIPAPQYRKYESPGKQTSKNSSKWGIILGVHSSLHSQSVSLPSILDGRAVAADVIIPTNGGRGFVHRPVGLYAPYDPGGDFLPELTSYWDEIYSICRAAPHSWEVIGDCNVTLSASESSGTSDSSGNARDTYLHFLHSAAGLDVWQRQGNNDAAHCFTWRAYNGLCQSIIDRWASLLHQFLSQVTSSRELIIERLNRCLC
jgi:hypothetical protein